MFGHKKINRRLANLEAVTAKHEDMIKVGGIAIAGVGAIALFESGLGLHTRHTLRKNNDFVANQLDALGGEIEDLEREIGGQNP